MTRQSKSASADLPNAKVVRPDRVQNARDQRSPHSTRWFVLLLVFLLGGFFSSDACATDSPTADSIVAKTTVKITVNGKSVIGRVVEANNYRVLILRRDGRMVEYQRSKIDKMQRVGSFQPYSSLKLQSHYRKLFGKNYEVTRTRNYVVVHPPGLNQQWAQPFEELYDRFQYYFNVRGYTLTQPEFPMVVVVFDSRAEFNKVASKQGVSDPNSYAGYYSAVSNWIVTYKNSGQTNGSWEKNETLIHEALHQYAFNHGIHQRWAPTPQWCAEGLASMFEAPGINNARLHNSKKDKLNSTYVRLLKHSIAENKLDGQIRRLVASDRVFQEDIALAYSAAWGLAFYLAETQPSNFDSYLQRIAARDRSSNYSASDRLADFAQSFGGNFELLEAHFKRYVDDLD